MIKIKIVFHFYEALTTSGTQDRYLLSLIGNLALLAIVHQKIIVQMKSCTIWLFIHNIWHMLIVMFIDFTLKILLLWLMKLAANHLHFWMHLKWRMNWYNWISTAEKLFSIDSSIFIFGLLPIYTTNFTIKLYLWL